MDPVVQAIINNINGQTPLNVSNEKEVRCEICKKHKNQFKFLCRKKNSIDLNCVICNYLCKDMNDYEAHVTSEMHVERAKRIKPVQQPQQSVEIPPPQPVHTHFLQPLPPHQELLRQEPLSGPSNSFPPPLANEKQMHDSLNEKALRQILAKDRREWNCVNCSVTCQSISSWEAHLVSKKHRKNRHKFHTYPGISKELVKKKYQNSFVRACETVGNEFIDEDMIFYCKRCDVRMETKMQLEIHMTSNQHKMNHPIEPVRTYAPVENYGPVQSNPQLFNFENSSYGYGFRNWSAEQFVFNPSTVPPPTQTQAELERQLEMQRQRQLVEEAKSKLLARFPFYAINMQQDAFVEDISSVPLPVPPPDEHPFLFSQ